MDTQNVKPDLEKPSNNSTHDIFVPSGQEIKLSSAIGSIGDAWDFISPKIGMWILLGIIYSAINLVLAFIPYLSFILSNILEPLFIAGIISVCETQRTTGKVKIKRLFYGLKYKFSSLLVVGLVVFGITFIGHAFAAIIDGDDLYEVVFGNIYFSFLHSDFNSMIAEDDSPLSFLSLFSIIISLFLSTAYSWFAPALIILNGFNVKKAISVSLNAICKNLLGILLFLFFINLLVFISAIPLLLGLLFTTPLCMATYYSFYRNVFYKKEKYSENHTN
ncbi:hypothetical protein FE394_14475 [Xenorhabdus sp. Reich]|uniref:Transmembrane protein n=1 Tax=Xenorhabdus littoralis TaxID=2582835 RepID=A0ABU4SP72_9GAMM|nr:BPSS1780 family membrane protein [Xenorhabdus sp. Reich]MDX8000369.1 hypothetical protein [Xenorhabdus sp. Reich]